mgnify:CR=1 FL=1
MGWARANVIYDLAPGLPKFGTLTEAMYLMVWQARTSQSVAATRAVAQAAIGGDKAAEAFEDYRNTVNRSTVTTDKKKLHSRLEDLKKMQAVKFRPVEKGMGPQSKTRLRTVRRKT